MTTPNTWSHDDSTRVYDFAGTCICLERRGKFIEILRSDGSVMVRFQNFDGIEILGDEKSASVAAPRRSFRSWLREKFRSTTRRDKWGSRVE